MAIPDFQTLMLPVLKIAAGGGEVRIRDVVDILADEFALTDEERAHRVPSKQQTTFGNRVSWAKSYLSKAGLVELTRRAHFRITETGRQVLNSPPDRITVRFLEQFPAFKEAREGEAEAVAATETVLPVADNPLTPDEVMRQAHARIEASLADEILQRVQSGTPAFFEKTVVRLLITMGYGGSVTELDKALVGKSGDDGVDGVIDQDPLGLDRVYVQAKRYADGNTVGAGAIRDFFGSLNLFKATKGLFVTTSAFTTSARETADRLGTRIVLIDGIQLAKLMIRHEVGCRIEETLHIKRVDEDFFE
ncbi:restriction endonuclease [Azospirillum thiophilum]|uniref:Restriction endonuclease n=1 Tax=Azospirillum thiophilum TaxID=528244 RepID=A0AAC8VVK2_9PROT|nr:restriction endonuclease [Azospirillum thiophilum]ALG70127.1 restriction endonuclease [Azospirillum thiophilum]KJR66192.1 restriction endonuclease [Azospirillum thiophilum]